MMRCKASDNPLTIHTSELAQPLCKHPKNWGFKHWLLVERQEEIQLKHKINDTLSSCSTLIALAQLPAEWDYKWTKVEHGRRRKKGGEKRRCMAEDRWRRAADISLLFLQAGKGHKERGIHKSWSNIWGVVVAGRRKRSLRWRERGVWRKTEAVKLESEKL